MKIINFSNKYLSQYVKMRNEYCSELRSNVVTEDSTKEWLKNNIILCAVEDCKLLGAVILNIHTGEITIFHQSRGIGGLLLKSIETYAKKQGFKKIWAWTSINNNKAQKLFTKNNYISGTYYGKNL